MVKITYLGLVIKLASVKELKDELRHRDQQELLEIVVRLSRYKKENKELLTYLLFQATDESAYIHAVKEEMDEQFLEINVKSYYFIKKSMRKILRNVKKRARNSGKKETEVELLLYFLKKMDDFTPSYRRDRVLLNLFDRQKKTILKLLEKVHEDLQYDFGLELNRLSR